MRPLVTQLIEDKMHDSRSELIAKSIGLALHQAPVRVIHSQTCSGGCIHTAEIVELADGRRYFVKSNSNSSAMFEQEALGLQALQKANSLRVPAVIAHGDLGANENCLILEAIQPGTKQVNFFEKFAIGLAQLHQMDVGEKFGWQDDNFIGSSVQKTRFHSNWCEFFAEYRLRPQFNLARQKNGMPRELFSLGERLLQRLDALLAGAEESPSLLHGDLWSGNFLADEAGNPVIFDPAVYFGHREAELAMPLLFGGFPADFFTIYDAAFPLEDGWRDRVEIYKLYHLLNHLNLFGSGYLASCLEIIRKFA